MKRNFFYLMGMTLIFSYGAQLQAGTSAEICKKLFDDDLVQEAISPCTKAAKADDRLAQTILGEIYDEMGDSVKTALWWEKASTAGYQPARNLLALKYFYGGTVFGSEKGWQQDYPKAFKIWSSDAEKGVKTSQFMIGVMYQKGLGIEKNPSEAWYWLKVALANGYKGSTDVLIALGKEITPEQKHLAEEKLLKRQ
ncbi:MAG: sel1 repeat family protein [Thiotrichaceae bacterium]|nr:sel1 repeat family protein [Thiotrichaceae bacterium]